MCVHVHTKDIFISILLKRRFQKNDMAISSNDIYTCFHINSAYAFRVHSINRFSFQIL